MKKAFLFAALLVSFFSASVGWAHKPGKVHGHDALMVNLGASTTYGYTFDSSLLGLPFGYYLTKNHHIPLFAQFLKFYFGVKDVIVHNFAIPGKTSAEVLSEQVPQALAVLLPNRLHKVVFTVEGGGNDLRHFQVANMAYCTSADPMDQYMCLVNLNAALDEIEDNLWAIVSTLQEAAPDAVIILQTQYNSLYDVLPNGQPCADAGMLMLADLAFEGNPAYGHPVKGMNVRIREIAAELGVKVGDIAGFLYTAPGELYKNPDFFGGDCTHLAGRWDGIPAIGLPGDGIGLGYSALLASFIYAMY